LSDLAVTATFEIFRGGAWVPAARLVPADERQGYGGACQFDYRLEYAATFAGQETAVAAGLSCQYPADFQAYNLPSWPAFVLDILPSGYGRRQWLEQLELPDGPSADWPLLMRGTAYPPGNLRVAEAIAGKDPSTLVPTADGHEVAMREHPGFPERDLIDRTEAFVEYAYQHGIYAAGASDVQGAAPKLLLNRDHAGAWHAEGRLDDADVESHWLVKRPRGDRQADRQVLRNEAAYMRVAAALDLKVYAKLRWQEDNLFVPRFDRQVRDGDVARYGMESLCSATGISEYGARIHHEELCNTIIGYSDRVADDLLEYIQRDIANVVLGNKDNHARNSALLRFEDGRVELAPLFDFAPMYLDPEGIARVCRWSADIEAASHPEWRRVLDLFPEHQPFLTNHLRRFGQAIERLTDTMRTCGVDDDIIEHRNDTIDRHAQQLLAL
jgi:serine/threonine-protein kinase HipA